MYLLISLCLVETECPKCLSVVDFQALFDKGINCTTYREYIQNIGSPILLYVIFVRTRTCIYCAYIIDSIDHTRQDFILTFNVIRLLVL
jgi:hypothetical protein